MRANNVDNGHLVSRRRTPFVNYLYAWVVHYKASLSGSVTVGMWISV